MAGDLPLVVSSGTCVGCGACAVAAPEHVAVRLTVEGTYVPFAIDGGDLSGLDDEVLTRTSKVCPFRLTLWNENDIAMDQFAGDGVSHHDVTGYYRRIVAGHVTLDGYRELGTSGGMTSWMLDMLLSSGEVDGVIHVASTLDAPPAAVSKYRISRFVDEVAAGRKSRYHVQTLSEVLAQVREEPGRYAIVGVPCFIKAVRLLAESDEVIRDRIVFTAALVCGHYKSTLYSEYLAWSAGLPLEDVVDIDYRHKEPGRPPNRYSVRVSSRDGTSVVSGVEKIPMADWGMGSSSWEHAIIATTSSVKPVTSASGMRGCRRSCPTGRERISPSPGPRWPTASWRWARRTDPSRSSHGPPTMWRTLRRARCDTAAPASLYDWHIGEGRWAPPKRVEPIPASELSSPFAQRMLNREAIAIASPAAFLEARRLGDLQEFRRIMQPLIWKYDGGRGTTIWRRAAARTLRRLPPKGEALVRRLLRGKRFS